VVPLCISIRDPASSDSGYQSFIKVCAEKYKSCMIEAYIVVLLPLRYASRITGSACATWM
jgi:hypothetical protein